MAKSLPGQRLLSRAGPPEQGDVLAGGALPAGTFQIDATLEPRWGLLRYSAREQTTGDRLELWSTGVPGTSLRAALRALEQVRSPHLQRFLGTVTTPEGYELGVLEQPHGESLPVRMARTPLLAAEAVGVFDALARALDALHAAGLCHLEVRPEHVLRTAGEGGTVLCGLGQVHAEPHAGGEARTARAGSRRPVSRPAPSQQTGESQAALLSVCAYLAPEQILPERAGLMDRRTDIYALSALAFYVLTGVPPFGPDGDIATLGAHLRAWRPLCTSYRPDLAESVDAVLQRGLSLLPEQRPPSCGELLDDLRAALADAPGPRAPLRTTAPAEACVLLVAGSGGAQRELQGMVNAVSPQHTVLVDDGEHARTLMSRYRPALVLLHLPSLARDAARRLAEAIREEAEVQVVALYAQSTGLRELSRLGVLLVPYPTAGRSRAKDSRPLAQLLRRFLAPELPAARRR